jgi:hypothetical protein
VQQTPAYTPPPGVTVPPAAAPPRRGPNPVLLLLVGGGAAILLLCIGCFALGVFSALLNGTATPTAEPPPTIEVVFPTATRVVLGGPATPTTEALDTAVVPEDTAVAGEPTPNATLTATASDFDIDFTDYDDALGGVVIVGVVHNKGTERLENVKVVAELLDANGATVGTGDDTLLPLAIMEGDQTLPFQVTISSPGEGAERIHVKVNADVYDSSGFHLFDPAQGLTIEGTALNSGVLGPTVTGRVRNGGQKDATLVEVIAAGYDDSGQLVDTGFGFVTGEVAAGDASPFELTFMRPDVQIAKYDLSVIAQEK